LRYEGRRLVVAQQLRRCLSPRPVLKIDVGERLTGGVLYDETGVGFLGGPRRRETTGQLPQSSSASRFTAGAAGFLVLIQSADRPNRHGEPRRFDTMPSQPSHLADRFPLVTAAIAAIPARSCAIDGEAIVRDDEASPNDQPLGTG